MKIENKEGLGSKPPQMEENTGMKQSMVVPESKTGQNESIQNKKTIFERAIASANKHKIKLKPGRENAGVGNCSYESVIFNINDRASFSRKFNLTPSFYRRVWNVDLMNKILDQKIPWNPGMTRAELREGFAELMESGVYEREFFGDMMLAGIACGVEQKILIFHTNESITTTGQDPISVVDPRDYGGNINSEIPVVVAYNLVHFESLHPLDEKDIKETVRLVNSYSSKPSRYMQEYGFTSKDMPYLISADLKSTPGQKSEKRASHTSIDKPVKSQSPPPKKTKILKTAEHATKKDETNAKKTEDFILKVFSSKKLRMAK